MTPNSTSRLFRSLHLFNPPPLPDQKVGQQHGSRLRTRKREESQSEREKACRRKEPVSEEGKGRWSSEISH